MIILGYGRRRYLSINDFVKAEAICDQFAIKEIDSKYFKSKYMELNDFDRYELWHAIRTREEYLFWGNDIMNRYRGPCIDFYFMKVFNLQPLIWINGIKSTFLVLRDM